MKATTNLEIKIEVTTDEGESYEKTCDSIAEALNYLDDLKTKEVYHAIEF